MTLHETALRAVHDRDGATVVPYAGWAMPLRYSSDLAEHRAVRASAGLFDLSHMAQLEVSGPDASAAEIARGWPLLWEANADQIRDPLAGIGGAQQRTDLVVPQPMP